jgi:glycoprotein endo-alpha-1,2-mannosidase
VFSVPYYHFECCRYGTPETDGQWWHWNHEYLANWDKTDRNKYPTGVHQPPEDIGANFYPSLGPYSSASEPIIRQHMAWIRQVSTDAVFLLFDVHISKVTANVC